MFLNYPVRRIDENMERMSLVPSLREGSKGDLQSAVAEADGTGSVSDWNWPTQEFNLAQETPTKAAEKWDYEGTEYVP